MAATSAHTPVCAYNSSMSSPTESSELLGVALFPLPNVVLFPRAVLPLHIFEERYKTMTADVLAGDGCFAMALLKSGWEKDYYGRPAIESVVCVGQILSHEKLPDGKYNFLLQGRKRARVLREHRGKAYRVADLAPIAETHAMEIDLEFERARLAAIFSTTRLAMLPLARQFKELLTGPMSTSDVADLAAFNLLEDIRLKQSLLEEADVRRRITRIADALEEVSAAINPGLQGFPEGPSVN